MHTHRHTRRNPRQQGFTLVELVVVVAVVGLLASHAAYNATIQQKHARRTEVTLGLDALGRAQHAFYLDNGRYAATFDELTFDIDGSFRVSPTTLRAQRYTYVLSQPWGERSYYVTATGQIDGDAFPDTHILEAGRP